MNKMALETRAGRGAASAPVARRVHTAAVARAMRCSNRRHFCLYIVPPNQFANITESLSEITLPLAHFRKMPPQSRGYGRTVGNYTCSGGVRFNREVERGFETLFTVHQPRLRYPWCGASLPFIVLLESQGAGVPFFSMLFPGGAARPTGRCGRPGYPGQRRHRPVRQPLYEPKTASAAGCSTTHGGASRVPPDWHAGCTTLPRIRRPFRLSRRGHGNRFHTSPIYGDVGAYHRGKLAKATGVRPPGDRDYQAWTGNKRRTRCRTTGRDFDRRDVRGVPRRFSISPIRSTIRRDRSYESRGPSARIQSVSFNVAQECSLGYSR